VGERDGDAQERARQDEARRFAEMVHADRGRQETLAKVRAEFERRAADGDPEAKGVIADLDRAAVGD
jgi:hypothetical protein